VRLLLDTNVFLEVILEQPRANEARAVLEKPDQHDLYITDFSLHSIGVLLFRQSRREAFQQFAADLERAGIGILSLAPTDMVRVVEAAGRFTLDFDDAYQYAVAESFGLELVSFDADFDRTARGRLTPDQVR
jgi:predicted nucleic acid-binding protein